MVVLERQILGLLKYRKALFPTPDEVHGLVGRLAINELVRFECPPLEALESRRQLVDSHPVATVCIDLTQDLDTILKRMEAKSCRQLIRRAEKMTDRIGVTTNDSAAPSEFLEMYNAFAAAKGPVPRLSAGALEHYLGFSDIWMLALDGRPLCGHVILKDAESKRVLLMFSANRRFEGKEIATLCGILNRYLHWQEIQSYRNCAMESYDFGGVGHENPFSPGFNQFKTSFGGDIVRATCYTFAGSGSLAKYAIGTYNWLRDRKVVGLI